MYLIELVGNSPDPNQLRRRFNYESLGGFLKLSQLEWVSSGSTKPPMTLFIDLGVLQVSNFQHTENLKIAYLNEPFEIIPDAYLYVRQFSESFSVILTHDLEYFSGLSNVSYFVTGGSLLKPVERLLVKEKISLISMVVSEKNTTSGHKFRKVIYDKYRKASTIHFMGRGAQSFGSPLDAYSEFKFSIVVENVKKRQLFTEKLIEPMLFECIPIYWGASNLSEFFNQDGILSFDTLEELESILREVTEEKYESMRGAILHNKRAALELISKELNLQNALASALGKSEMVGSIHSVMPNFEKVLSGDDPIEIASKYVEDPLFSPMDFRDPTYKGLKRWWLESCKHRIKTTIMDWRALFRENG